MDTENPIIVFLTPSTKKGSGSCEPTEFNYIYSEKVLDLSDPWWRSSKRLDGGRTIYKRLNLPLVLVHLDSFVYLVCTFCSLVLSSAEEKHYILSRRASGHYTVHWCVTSNANHILAHKIPTVFFFFERRTSVRVHWNVKSRAEQSSGHLRVTHSQFTLNLPIRMSNWDEFAF